MNPIKEIADIWMLAKRNNVQKLKIAMCLTTIDANGYPNSRFLDLKNVTNEGLVFCTSLTSNKNSEIMADSRCGIGIWWEHIARQIRIKGNIKSIEEEISNTYWKTRNPDAQLTTITFNQSEVISDYTTIEEKFHQQKMRYSPKTVFPKPDAWGCLIVIPEEIEILEFRENRLHHRVRYSKQENEWRSEVLQP